MASSGVCWTREEPAGGLWNCVGVGISEPPTHAHLLILERRRRQTEGWHEAGTWLARGHGNPRVHQALGSGAGPYLKLGPTGWPGEAVKAAHSSKKEALETGGERGC